MKSRNPFVRCCIFATILLATLLAAALASRSARACEPPPPDYVPPTPIPLETQVASVIRDTQIVLDGTVKTWVASSNMDSILTVQVARYLKGHGPKSVQISGYFWDCPPNFAFYEGSRIIFFVNGDPTSSEPLQIRAWFNAQEAVVASVKISTGQEPMAPDKNYNAVWLSLLLFTILGLAGLMMRFRRTRA